MGLDRGELDKAIAAIGKSYGDDSVHYGATTKKVDRVSTGSLEMDIITGGGIPLGRFSRFWGSWSSGKSLMCWSVIKNAQARGMLCAYYNIEKQFDPEFTANTGVDIDKLLIVEGATIEETGTKLEALLGSVDIHVIDSCSSAVSVDELNSQMEEWHRALGPRAWGKVLRRAGDRLRPENAIILVDQARDVFGMKAEAPPGGRMMEHTSSLTARFRRGAWLYRTEDGLLSSDDKFSSEGLADTKEPDGIEIQVHITKSRVCRPLRSARLFYDLKNCKFDWSSEYCKAALHYQVVSRNGAWYTLPDGKKVQGEMGLRRALIDDKSLRSLVKKTAMQDV